MAKKKAETIAKELSEGAVTPWKNDAYELAMNIIFLREKLKQTRELIGVEPVAVPYDNGGGQSGVRQNPLYKGYDALLKSYCLALSKLGDLIEDEEGSDEGGTVMDLFRKSALDFKVSVQSPSQE